MEKHKKIIYPSLNGLRALSIVFVIIHHFDIKKYYDLEYLESTWVAPFKAFLEDGHLGVNVFFVISGFLITSLLLQEEAFTQKISLKRFFIRRTLRIFPAYYFMLFCYFIMQWCNEIHLSEASWWSSLTYTKYFNWEEDWISGHAWSLSIEEHFYIFWPFVFIAGAKFRKWIAIGLLIAVPCVRTYVYFYPVSWINELTIFMRVDAIAMGCLFALYQNEILNLFRSHWRAIFISTTLGLFLLRGFPLAFSYVHLEGIFIPLGVTHGTLANIFIACIMMYSVFGPRKLWFKLLNWKVLNYIGTLSYSIYLWQQMFITKGKVWYTAYPQNLLFIAIMALFSFYVIEKPFLKLKNRFSSFNSPSEPPKTVPKTTLPQMTAAEV